MAGAGDPMALSDKIGFLVCMAALSLWLRFAPWDERLLTFLDRKHQRKDER